VRRVPPEPLDAIVEVLELLDVTLEEHQYDDKNAIQCASIATARHRIQAARSWVLHALADIRREEEELRAKSRARAN
jgi:hypothetical protein